MKLIKNLKKINKTKLKDICEINLGQSPSSESYTQNESDFPFFQGAADFSYKNTIIRNYTNSPKKIANKDDLLMTVRAPVGRVNFANVDCSIGRGICSFKFKDESLKDYIYFYLNNLYKKNGWNMDIQGAIFDAVNKIQIENKDITIDFQNYEKISIFLNNFENRIINYKKLLEKIEIRNNYYADKLLSGELSIENGKITEKNVSQINVKLMDYLEIINGYPFKSNEMKSSGEFPVIKMSNFKDNKVSIKKNTVYTDNLIDKVKILNGDLLIGLSGSVGEYAIFDLEETCLLNQRCIILRKKDNQISEYLKIYIIHKVLEELKNSGEGGVIKNVSSNYFQDIEIKISDNYKEVYEFIIKIDDEKDKVKKLLELEEKRFEWLSDKLLSGEYIIED